MEKIKFGNVVNATINVSNETDSKRKYDITAQAVANDGKINYINNGQVLVDGRMIAHFNAAGINNLDIRFMDTSAYDSSEILATVTEFIESVKNSTTPTNVSIETIIG